MADEMTLEEVRDALARAQADACKVQIKHRTLADHFNGFVLGVSDSLVYLRMLRNFQLDDFAVIRVADVWSVRSGPSERFFEKVLRAEGRLDELEPPLPLDITSIESVLAGLLELDPHVTIEDDERFLVGRLEGVEGQVARLTYIRVDGTVDPSIREIDLPAIEVVMFGGDYLAMFRKYGSWDAA